MQNFEEKQLFQHFANLIKNRSMHLLPIFYLLFFWSLVYYYTSDQEKRQKIGSNCVDLIIPPLPEGGGGILYYLCPSVRPSNIFSSHFSQHFFVAFFSLTIDGRNLIFGHKLHISMIYCGKRFWIRQIPTSCLRLSWFLYTLNIYAHFLSHFSQQLLMAEI